MISHLRRPPSSRYHLLSLWYHKIHRNQRSYESHLRITAFSCFWLVDRNVWPAAESSWAMIWNMDDFVLPLSPCTIGLMRRKKGWSHAFFHASESGWSSGELWSSLAQVCIIISCIPSTFLPSEAAALKEPLCQVFSYHVAKMAIAPPLSVGWGYGIVLGLGALFAFGMVSRSVYLEELLL